MLCCEQVQSCETPLIEASLTYRSWQQIETRRTRGLEAATAAHKQTNKKTLVSTAGGHSGRRRSLWILIAAALVCEEGGAKGRMIVDDSWVIVQTSCRAIFNSWRYQSDAPQPPAVSHPIPHHSTIFLSARTLQPVFGHSLITSRSALFLVVLVYTFLHLFVRRVR